MFVRAVWRTRSVCKCRVNAWNAKGEMLPGHAHARGDAGVLDLVVIHTKKRCLGGSEQ